MRRLETGSHRFAEVIVVDELGAGEACHEYYISPIGGRKDVPAGEYGHVYFQNGPIKENGVNGCHQEDLLAIVIDRLQHFQAGKYNCRENAIALTKLEECLMWLQKRTANRMTKGVEGTYKI